MKDCIFCKIAKGELPSYKVYEDPNFMAFLDIKPLNKGHVLVIPKKHFRWVQDTEQFSEYWRVAGIVTKAMTKSLNSDHVNYVTLGNMVHHAHIHIIPRYIDDGMSELPDWARNLEFTPDEMRNISDKIKGEL